MTCVSCKELIEKEVLKIAGVQKATIQFASETLIIEGDAHFHEALLFESLLKLGYKALVKKEIKEKSFYEEEWLQGLVFLFIGSLFMLLMFIPSWHFFSNILQLAGGGLLLCLPAQKKYIHYLGVFLRRGHSNMHTLIAIGIYTSFSYSLFLFIENHHAHLYVESIPFILGLSLVGSSLEKKAKTKAQGSLAELYKLQIKFAQKIMNRETGAEESVPVMGLVPGDIIVIRPGEKIPLKGKIIFGESHIDESLITGESLPRRASINDIILAGGINLEGLLKLEIEATYSASEVLDIIRFVERAESRKMPIEKYADLIIKFFTPGVIFIAIMTFLFWSFYVNLAAGIIHFVSVLVIACPCALGLAVPITIMVSTRHAALKGLLINGGEALEKGPQIDTIIFDKTGTLTLGRPIVEDFLPADPSHLNDLFGAIGSAALYSQHPLSKAIVQYLLDKKIKLDDPDKFINISGLGLEAMVNGKRVQLGNEKLISKAPLYLDKLGSKVHVAIDGEYRGTFILNDYFKPEAKEVIAQLQAFLGEKNEIWMLTGDNEGIAKKVANDLGIKHVCAGVTPLKKEEFIRALSANGKKVMMVGDGINDAMALVSADLSMACDTGSDIALNSSDMSLLDGNLRPVVTFFKISQLTMKTIKENLFFSFIYNLICVPLAAGCFEHWGWHLDPKLASFAMGLSSLSVLLNALKLQRKMLWV